MSVLDRLYRLEIEFHGLIRGLNPLEAASVHTSYALQKNYETLLRAVGTVDQGELARAAGRMMGMGDPRDVQAAYHSLQQLVRVA